MIFVAFLIFASLLIGLFGLNRAVRLLRQDRILRSILLLVITSPLLAIGVNSVRAVPLVEVLFPQRAYRTTDPARCSTMRQKAYRLVSPAWGSEDPHAGDLLLRCAVQTVVNDGQPTNAAPLNAKRCWPTSGAPNILLNCYRMAFLEFSKDGNLIDGRQKQLLYQLLADWRQTHPGVPVYAVFYVHGWRHDARPGDQDVRRLRVMASYSAGHMQERCRIQGRQCQTMVLSIYVSWPGAIGLIDGEEKYHALINSLTFASRKRVSDNIGQPVLYTLGQISETIRATSPDSRIIMLGHSLGGNLLLSGASPRVMVGLAHAARVYDGTEPGRIEDERLGMPTDLMVLLNPAAQARKWDRLSLAAARYFQTKGTACPGSVCRIWPATMPPRLIYAASRCKPGNAKATAARSTKERDAIGLMADGTYPCDDVVDGVFGTSQKWLEFEWGALDWRGIGHLSETSSGSEETGALNRQNAVYVEANWQKGLRTIPTTYANARNYTRVRCFVEPSWLYCARSRGNDTDQLCGNSMIAASPWQGWNMGDGRRNEKTLGRFAERGAPGQSNIQFGYPSLRGQRQGVTAQRSDPMWGVEAHVTAITRHGQIASSPFVCSYVKMLFDRATTIPANETDGPDQYRDINAKDYALMVQIFGR